MISLRNIITAGLAATIVALSIGIWQKNRTIANLKDDLNKTRMANINYELRLQSLADRYKTSLEKFEVRKRVVHTVYRDRIKTAVKIVPIKECEYLKKRIKEYVEKNTTTDSNITFERL